MAHRRGAFGAGPKGSRGGTVRHADLVAASAGRHSGVETERRMAAKARDRIVEARRGALIDRRRPIDSQDAGGLWLERHASVHAGSLAFQTLFSMAPVAIIAPVDCRRGARRKVAPGNRCPTLRCRRPRRRSGCARHSECASQARKRVTTATGHSPRLTKSDISSAVSMTTSSFVCRSRSMARSVPFTDTTVSPRLSGSAPISEQGELAQSCIIV